MKTQFTLGAIAANSEGYHAMREGSLFRVYYNFAEVKQTQQLTAEGEQPQEEEQTLGTANYVDITASVDYATIVSAIVKEQYSDDDVQALLANYTEAQDSASDLTDEKREEYLTEYAAFQQHRRTAKAIARHIMSNDIR